MIVLPLVAELYRGRLKRLVKCKNCEWLDTKDMVSTGWCNLHKMWIGSTSGYCYEVADEEEKDD